MMGTNRLFPGDLGQEPPLSPRERSVPTCPACGNRTWDLVRDHFGDTVGCLECMDVVNDAEGTEYALSFVWNGGD